MPVPCKSKCALCLSHYGAGAVADGNAEANGFAGAAGTMEAIYIGNDTNWWRTRPGPNHKQHQQQQQGPFIMADLEDGMFSGECVSVVTLLRPQMHNNAATIMLLTVSLSVVESPESEPYLLCNIIIVLMMGIPMSMSMSMSLLLLQVTTTSIPMPSRPGMDCHT